MPMTEERSPSEAHTLAPQAKADASDRDGGLPAFFKARPRLFGIAYRMLGSVAEAGWTPRRKESTKSSGSCGRASWRRSRLRCIAKRATRPHLNFQSAKRERNTVVDTHRSDQFAWWNSTAASWIVTITHSRGASAAEGAITTVIL